LPRIRRLLRVVVNVAFRSRRHGRLRYRHQPPPLPGRLSRRCRMRIGLDSQGQRLERMRAAGFTVYASVGDVSD
jgi:hypothetical protein